MSTLIGITGGLACGKSTVTRLFAQHGAVCFSADEAARATLQPPSHVLHEIANTFGQQYLTPDGALDRAALGAYVFSQPDARRRLEAITHPAIIEHLRRQVEEARAAAAELIAVEVPLLFEAGLEGWFDCVVVVTASEQTQVSRLMARDGFTETDALRRIHSQMPLAEKAARADYVIPNEGDVDALEEAVGEIVREERREERG